MAAMPHYPGKVMIALAAGSCGLLALAYSDWRSEIRAQDYPPPGASAAAGLSQCLDDQQERLSDRARFCEARRAFCQARRETFCNEGFGRCLEDAVGDYREGVERCSREHQPPQLPPSQRF
jgi:hypothetical protein